MFNLKLEIQFLLIVCMVFISTGCGEEENDQVAIRSGTHTNTPIDANQQELIDAINKERSKSIDCYPNDDSRGMMSPVPPLSWNEDLYASALEHSYDLANSNTFSHMGSGTQYDLTGNGKPSLFYERIVGNGYSNYYSVGENIAGGQQTLEEVMKAWMESPGHCMNIMSPKYTEVGIAIIKRSDSMYGVYWTQNFGSKQQ